MNSMYLFRIKNSHPGVCQRDSRFSNSSNRKKAEMEGEESCVVTSAFEGTT
jgi:hypothetical protein